MFDTYTTRELFLHWRLCARWAREYRERAQAARKPIMRLTYRENFTMWRSERKAVKAALVARLTAVVAVG